MTLKSLPEAPAEYLTFGRQPYMLVRIWLFQMIVIFGDIRVFRIVHPGLLTVVEEPHLVEIYLLETMVAFLVLCTFVVRMSQLTFSPRLREPRHLAGSVASYILLASSVLLLVGTAPNLPPVPAGGISLLELVLSVTVLVNLAALLALAVYAQYYHAEFPAREQIPETISAWFDSLGWVDEPESSREKRKRYNELQQQADAMADLLEHAETVEGMELRDDFREWREAYERRSLLSQEAIIEGGVRNDRLAREHEQLQDINDRLERLTQ